MTTPTITRAEAHEIADELVDSIRATFGNVGASIASRSSDPDASEIGEQVQEAIDRLIVQTEADLRKAIGGLPAVEVGCDR